MSDKLEWEEKKGRINYDERTVFQVRDNECLTLGLRLVNPQQILVNEWEKVNVIKWQWR